MNHRHRAALGRCSQEYGTAGCGAVTPPTTCAGICRNDFP